MTKATFYNTLANSEEDSDIHLIVSQVGEFIYIKPSRPVNRQRLMGILQDAMHLLQSSACQTVHPNDCSLRVFLTVDDDQPIPDPMD